MKAMGVVFGLLFLVATTLARSEILKVLEQLNNVHCLYLYNRCLYEYDRDLYVYYHGL